MRSKDPELMNRIKAHIEDCYEASGSAPSVQEIATAMGIAKTTAYRYLVDMAEQHMISYKSGVISTEKIRKLSPEVNRAALVGSIPCGEPDEREALVEEYIPLPVSVFGSGDFYVLRASGDSMIDAEISSGDLVVIEKQQTANIGDIVVALTDDRLNTLKRLCYDEERNCYYLHPENEAYEDIYVQSLSIQGVARHIIKAL